MSAIGISVATLALTNLTSGIIKPKRNIGGMVADVTVEEQGNDELAITQHPVQRTADITDHAYPLPPTLRVRIGYSPAGPAQTGIVSQLVGGLLDTFGKDPVPLQTIYQQYLDLQKNRELLEVQTGKRLYEDMLIKSISITTDQETENALFLVLELQQIILVDTQTVQVPSNSVQKTPQVTGNEVTAGVKAATPAPATINTRAAQQVLAPPGASAIPFVGNL